MGNKIEIKRESGKAAQIKLAQPVLIQKMEDEFQIPSGKPPKTPAVAGLVLVRGDESQALGRKESTEY